MIEFHELQGYRFADRLWFEDAVARMYVYIDRLAQERDTRQRLTARLLWQEVRGYARQALTECRLLPRVNDVRVALTRELQLAFHDRLHEHTMGLSRLFRLPITSAFFSCGSEVGESYDAEVCLHIRAELLKSVFGTRWFHAVESTIGGAVNANGEAGHNLR